jgi:putative transposase
MKQSLRRSFLHVANARKTYLHTASARIVRDHGTIVVEKLQIKNMVRNGSLAGSIHDAAWASFKSMLVYKAEKAGGRVIVVDPKFTSQDCSGCGTRVVKDLSVREHSCPSCGLVLDRDINAARNILHKAKWGLEVGNVAHRGERRPRNIESGSATLKFIF